MSRAFLILIVAAAVLAGVAAARAGDDAPARAAAADRAPAPQAAAPPASRLAPPAPSPAPVSGTPAAGSADARLLRLARTWPRLAAAHQQATRARFSPTATQRLYDTARDLEENARRIEPLGASCAPVRGALLRYAAAARQVAEGVDQLLPARRARAAARAGRALPRLRAAIGRCTPTSAEAVRPVPRATLTTPRDGEASFGGVSAAAPAGATAGTIFANGQQVGSAAVQAGTFEAVLELPPGEYDLEVRFSGTQAALPSAGADDVFLLPRSGETAAPPALHADAALGRSLARAGSGFDGFAAVFVSDIASGRTAGWNTDARFPAASLVKLGVMLEAVDRAGGRPGRSATAYDVAAIGGWSSNLATNRLLRVLGSGSEAEGTRDAQRALRRLGASRSTFTGSYIVGTAWSATGTDVVRQPPLTSRRLTTARDMAEAMRRLHLAAVGRERELRQLGLTRHQARVLLAMLLRSQPLADNRGLLRPSLGPAVPIAQKHGWIRSSRHSVGVVYAPGGPRVVVVLTNRPSGLSFAQAERLGRRVAALR